MYSNFNEHLQSTIDGIAEAVHKTGCLNTRGFVRNVYKSNTGKTAAWTRASHIEKPPKKKETPTA